MPAKLLRRPLVWMMVLGMPLCVAAGFAASRMVAPVSAGNRNAVSKPAFVVADHPLNPGARSLKTAVQADGVFQEQREWIERIRTATAEDLPALWKEVSAISDAYQCEAVRDLLYQKWVAADPAGCLMAFVHEGENGPRGKIMSAWLRRDADGAFAWALAGGDAEKIKDRTRLMFSQLAGIDPAKFLSLAAGVNEEHLPSEAIQAAFRKLAKSDPAAAREALNQLGPKARNNGSWALGREWARTDSKAALAWAKGLAEPVERQSALRGVLASLARTNPEAAIAGLDLLEEVKDAKGEDPKKTIVSGLAGKDPRRAFDFVVSQFSDQGERLRLLAGAVLPKLGAEMKPVELAALLDRAGIVRAAEGIGMSTVNMPDGTYYFPNGFDLNMILYSGGRSLPELADPAGAFRELAAAEMTPASKFTADETARQWISKDLAGTLRAFEAASDGPFRDMLTSALLSQASTNADLSLLAKLETSLGSEAQWVTESIIGEAAQVDPFKVLEWAGKLPAGAMQTKAQTTALSAWTAYDPTGALAWADRQPEENQPALYHAISSAREESDSYENSQWVSSLPVGHQRDEATKALLENLAFKDPYSSLEWAKSINHAGTQAEAMWSLFSGWMDRDAPAARQALDTLELPPGEKAVLESHLKAIEKN